MPSARGRTRVVRVSWFDPSESLMLSAGWRSLLQKFADKVDDDDFEEMFILVVYSNITQNTDKPKMIQTPGKF